MLSYWHLLKGICDNPLLNSGSCLGKPGITEEEDSLKVSGLQIASGNCSATLSAEVWHLHTSDLSGFEGCPQLWKHPGWMQWREQPSPWGHSPAHHHRWISLWHGNLILFSDFLIAKYSQSRSGDKKKKENMGSSYFHVGIHLPQSQWPEKHCPFSRTHSREENKQVRVLRSDTTTLKGSLAQPHLHLNDLLCLQLHSCPKKCRDPLRDLLPGMPQLSFPGWQSMAGFRASAFHLSTGISSFPKSCQYMPEPPSALVPFSGCCLHSIFTLSALRTNLGAPKLPPHRECRKRGQLPGYL